MKNDRSLICGALALALLLGGCASLSSTYTAPALNVPAQWNHPDARDAQGATGAWWKAFNDPVLDELVETALASNNDLAAAAIRVRRAQLLARLAENRPGFSGSVSSSVARPLDGGGSTRSSNAGLGASYEIDLWNRLGSQTDAARWEAQATGEDRESAAQALAGTTATLYWQLGYLNQRLAAAAQSIAYTLNTLELVQTQYRVGAISSLEVSEARQSLASQRAALSQLEQQQVETSNALALLFDGGAAGTGAAGWNAPSVLPGGALPAVDAGLPAELLGRRPDLRAAEFRLREALAAVDATRASYYPALTLTGSLGSSSLALANVLKNPLAVLGVGLSLPFLQRTQMDLDIQVSRTQYEEAVLNFRQTLYQALADADNALSARRKYEDQAVQLELSLADAQNAERLYEVRYRSGAVALKSWLDAQEKRRGAQTALAENRLNRLVNHATLFQVLGGAA